MEDQAKIDARKKSQYSSDFSPEAYILAEKVGQKMSEGDVPGAKEEIREFSTPEGGKLAPRTVKDRGNWKGLLEQYLGEEKLASKHSSLLEAQSEKVQLDAVKLAYQVTGKLKDQEEGRGNITIRFDGMPKRFQDFEGEVIDVVPMGLDTN